MCLSVVCPLVPLLHTPNKLKNIIIFGLGRSSKWLIHTLSQQATQAKITAYDLQLPDWVPNTANLECVQIESLEQITILPPGSLVISLLPPAQHIRIAHLALENNCHLLTASYMSPEMLALAPSFQQKRLFSIHEAGLDPGIDHVTALHALDTFKEEGFDVVEFQSHCGGLPSLGNLNKWGYTFFWSPLNVLNAGKAGATYLLDGKEVVLNYASVFKAAQTLDIPVLGAFEYYPNRDSIGYMKQYGVPYAATFIRGTIRYPGFAEWWQSLIEAGLTGDAPVKSDIITYADLINNSTASSLAKQLVLGWDEKVINRPSTNAEALFHLLLNKLSPAENDLDRVVMYHYIRATKGKETKFYQFMLDLEGTPKFSAMSQTVGLPLKLICDLFTQGHAFKPGCYTVADADVRQQLHPLLGSSLPIREVYS